ncbi:glycosyltransferase family 4 protein [Mangrovimonas aestuarii]|uniref:glycosyltransferase family 4 protein n=1 Tax=Mangrovimonas aestuarii TaxID=3018443 RepID=UPI002379C2E7|nr:glycosyltransferase family 4 protein [Mangrovimonas aestuarii]
MENQTGNILLISSEFPPLPGGIGNHAFHLAKGLSKSCKVTVIADQRSEHLEEEKHFDKDLPFKVVRIPLSKPRGIMYLNRISKSVAEIKSVTTVMATGKFPLWLAAGLSLLYKRKYIAVIHGTEVNFKNLLLKRSIDAALKRFTMVVAVSIYTKELVDHLQLKDVRVIPNGIDYNLWQLNGEEKQELQGSPALITVGHVSERKGQANVIRQLPDLIKQYPDIHYHCVGIPSNQKEFEFIAKELKVENHITFHGVLPFSDLKQKLAASDVFIMLSQETDTGDVEGFGIAILEANVLGKPAIGAKGSGIEDAIKGGETGMLVDKDSPSEMGQALSEIMKDYIMYQQNARKWAKQHDWELVVKRYLELI